MCLKLLSWDQGEEVSGLLCLSSIPLRGRWMQAQRNPVHVQLNVFVTQLRYSSGTYFFTHEQSHRGFRLNGEETSLTAFH